MDIEEKIIKEIEKNNEVSKTNKQKFIKELNDNPILLCMNIQIENNFDEIINYSDYYIDNCGFDLENFLRHLGIDTEDYFIDSMYYGDSKFLNYDEAIDYSYDNIYEFVTEHTVNDKTLEYVL